MALITIAQPDDLAPLNRDELADLTLCAGYLLLDKMKPGCVAWTPVTLARFAATARLLESGVIEPAAQEGWYTLSEQGAQRCILTAKYEAEVQ